VGCPDDDEFAIVEVEALDIGFTLFCHGVSVGKFEKLTQLPCRYEVKSTPAGIVPETARARPGIEKDAEKPASSLSLSTPAVGPWPHDDGQQSG
jgi:hypothetical protein